MPVDKFCLSKVYMPAHLKTDTTTGIPSIPGFSEAAFKVLGSVVKKEDKALKQLIESKDLFKTNLLMIDKREQKLLKEKKVAPFNKGFSAVTTAVLATAAIATIVAFAILVWPGTGAMGLLIVAPILLSIALGMGFSITKLVQAYKRAPRLEKKLEESKKNSGVDDYVENLKEYLNKNSTPIKKAINDKIKKEKKEMPKDKQLAAVKKKEIEALRNARAELKCLNDFYNGKNK